MISKTIIRSVHTVSSAELTRYYDLLNRFVPRSYPVRFYLMYGCSVPYAYGTYHMRIRIWYNHTRMVYKTPLVYIVSLLRP